MPRLRTYELSWAFLTPQARQQIIGGSERAALVTTGYNKHQCLAHLIQIGVLRDRVHDSKELIDTAKDPNPWRPISVLRCHGLLTKPGSTLLVEMPFVYAAGPDGLNKIGTLRKLMVMVYEPEPDREGH